MKTREAEIGQLFEELRRGRGLGPEDVPRAMLREKIDRRNVPSARTIRRLEETGKQPRIYLAFGLCQFYDLKLDQIWPPKARSRSTR